VDMAAHLIATRRPGRVVATMDADWRPAFRVAAVPAYKAHRLAPEGGEETPDALVPQVAMIEQVLHAVGIPVVGVAGFEADDVIGTCTHLADGPVEIVTGDRDLFQLIRDDVPVRVLYTARGVRNIEVVTEEDITRRYGIPGRAYADFALLRGDPSDGLPGVAGVGEKSAAALVSKYGTIDAIIAAVDAGDATLSPGLRSKVRAAGDYLNAARVVVAVRRDVPLPPYDDALPATPRDPEMLVELSERWRLDSPLNRLLAALAGG
jgi:5'-3' exonuclease